MFNVPATVFLTPTTQVQEGGGPGYQWQIGPTMLTARLENSGVAKELLLNIFLYTFGGFLQGEIAETDPVYGRRGGGGGTFQVVCFAVARMYSGE